MSLIALHIMIKGSPQHLKSNRKAMSMTRILSQLGTKQGTEAAAYACCRMGSRLGELDSKSLLEKVRLFEFD